MTTHMTGFHALASDMEHFKKGTLLMRQGLLCSMAVGIQIMCLDDVDFANLSFMMRWHFGVHEFR